MKPVVFSEIAVLELEDAVCFYEIEFEGLGRRFKAEIYKAVLRIQSFPEAWSIEKADIRKCLIHKYPYKIIYSIESDHVFIIAIAHQHRRPDYWIDRMRNES